MNIVHKITLFITWFVFKKKYCKCNKVKKEIPISLTLLKFPFCPVYLGGLIDGGLFSGIGLPRGEREIGCEYWIHSSSFKSRLK